MAARDEEDSQSQRPDGDQEKYLKVKQVAEELGVSEMTVYRLAWRGRLRYSRFGERIIRIPLSALEAYKIAANRGSVNATEREDAEQCHKG